MFGSIRKHSKWLWGIIVFFTIISFVVFFGPGARLPGADGPRFNHGSIDGRPITSEELNAASRSVQLEYFLTHGQWPGRDQASRQRGFDLERAVYERLLLMARARDLGISISPESAARVASEVIRGSGASSPSEFQQRVLGREASLADLGAMAEQFLTQQQLMLTVGLPGSLVTTQAAALLWRHEHQEIAADVVNFPASDFFPNVTATLEDLQAHFAAQIERYRVPAKLAIHYIEFPVTNYWPVGGTMFTNNVTNITEFVAAVYQERGSNAFGGKALEEAGEQIVNETIRNLARRAATTNAQGIHFEITDVDDVPPDALPKAAASAGLELKTSPPFDNQSFNPLLPPAVVQRAFTLNAEHPVGEPVVTEDRVFLISLATNIPSHLPTFEAVSNRVEFDFKQMTANQMARAAGEALRATLVEGLARGERFGDIASANNVRPVALSPFSRSTRSLPELPPTVQMATLQEAAFQLSAGQLSEFIGGPAGGFLVYVKEFLPLDEKRRDQELPMVLSQVRQTAQNEAFQIWFRQQADVGLRNTPYFRTPPPGVAPADTR